MMINESQINDIISGDFSIHKNNKKNIKLHKSFFGSPLKKFINNIYKYDIPQESFIISLYYLNKYYYLNRDNIIEIKNMFNNIKIYVLTSIIISLKFILDYNFNYNQLCTKLDISYNDYIHTEIKILKGLNWKMFLDIKEFTEFKNLLEHHKD